MATLELEGLVKRFDDFTAVENFSLSVAHGEFVSLLGPSGCGKSTVLRMIAGLLEPDRGAIRIGGEDVTWLPPHKRSIGLVFQSYALFPHMSVYENVAFGLRQRRVGESELHRRVTDALEMVRMAGLEKRMPRELSGGQQQRVALARAVAPGPALLLLDEPLSNLDAKLRDAMRIEIRRLQQELAVTTVFVTHDQEEALTMSDRICVLSAGRLEQVGAPREVYEHPASAFVAAFFGRSNVLGGTVSGIDGRARIAIDGGLDMLAGTLPPGIEAGSDVRLTVRQEAIRVSETGLSGLDNVFDGRLQLVSFAGASVQFVVRLDNGMEITAEMPAGRGRPVPEAGAPIHVGWSADDVIVTAPS